jgi:hypothetical protein
MSAMAAAALGIKVFRANADGDVTVGMFVVPALNMKVVDLPKSECTVRSGF